MWIIADIFERCANGIVKAFTQNAKAEADAEQVEKQRLRIRAQLHGAIASTQDAAPEQAASPAVAAIAPETAVVVEAAPVEAMPAAPLVVVSEAAPAETAPAPTETAPAMPMGVRGDTVVRWCEALATGERRQMPDLLERLRKDKKVRVPELQLICAEVLGEAPQHRKKGEHLDVLRRHFVPTERARTPVAEEMRLAN